MTPSPPSGILSLATRQVRQPMLWAACAHALGIVAGIYAWRPVLWWVLAGTFLVCAASFFMKRRSWLAWCIALGVLFVGGALHIQLSTGSHLDIGIQAYADRQELLVTGHVIRDGRLQQSFAEFRQALDVQAEEVQLEAGGIIPVQSGIRLMIYGPRETGDEPAMASRTANAVMPVFHYGERIRFRTKLKHPRNFRNPGAFDYQGYLADRGIAALGSAKIADVKLLPGFSGNRLTLWRTRMHAAVIAKVHELWPARDAALLDAMVIGEEAFIDRDTRTDFQRSGTFHVLVVSGMNISILAFVVFWTVRRLRAGDIAATILTVGSCVAFAFITEVGAPVWRATLMCAIYLVTRLLYRDRAMLNAVGAAALGLLIFNPRELFTASFQMTFICVLIVAGIGVPILRRTTQLYKLALRGWDSQSYAVLLPPKVAQFRLDLQFIAERIGRFIGDRWSQRLIRGTAKSTLATSELIFVSATMQMGLALPMACYFHRATTIGLPANLAVVPLTQLLMPAAVAALGIGFLSPLLAKFPALLTTIALHGITGTVHGLGAARLADLRVAMPSAIVIALASGAIALGMVTARRRRLAVTGLAAMLTMAIGLALIPPRARMHSGVLEVTSIDVGEGDSTLLIAPDGRTLLIDAGGPIGPGNSQLDFGEDVVSPYLWTRGISRLDAVAITHGHSDHIGGMISVIRNFRPKELWVGLLPPSVDLERVIDAAQAFGAKIVRRWEGDEFRFGTTSVRVLFPPRDWPVGVKPQNNDSLVLLVRYGNTSVLLEGDAEKQVERRIAALEHPQADLLKVGHHGSANATTRELLQSVRPRFATISVGSGNSFGLPRLETLERLQQWETRVSRTDLNGATTFYLDGQGVTASPAVQE